MKHQDYYKRGKVECLEAIDASMTDEAYQGFLKGNILKYIWRYDLKDGLSDLKKASVYLQKLIELASKAENDFTIEEPSGLNPEAFNLERFND